MTILRDDRVTHGTAQLLRWITEATAERDEVLEAAERKSEQWRGTITAAFNAGVPAPKIAAAAGISKQRVYQIRDGRR